MLFDCYKGDILMAKSLVKIPAEVRDIADAISKGEVKNAKMEWSDDGSISFSADLSDGSARIIMNKKEFVGISQESTINITKPTNKNERLERIRILKAEGKTQAEIAKYTMTSQKTVSNDIKELKEKSLL